MGRHALRRDGLAAAVSSLMVAVAAASVVVLSDGGGTAAAAEAGTTRIALSDPSSSTPRDDRPFVVLPGGSSRPTGTGARVFTGPSLGLTQDSGTLLGGDGLLWLI